MANNNSDTEKVLRCAFYIRVSSQRQLEGVSLEAQENALYEYIKNHSYKYILSGKHHVYVDEAKSGKTSDRPAFQRMIKAAENREFDVILVWKLDRFFRNMSEASKYIKKLKEKHKVGVTSITQDFDTEGPFGAAIFAIMMAFAELESNLITERTILGKSQKASEGKFVGGGIPPYGYYLDENRVLHIHPEEAKVVRRIFNMFGKEGLGVKDISPLLNAEHLPIRVIPRGVNEEGKKKPEKISYFWSSSFIYKILNNEMYYGEYYYGKTSVGKGNLSKKDWEKINEKRANGEMVDMTDYTPVALLTIPCPPILSDDPDEARQIFLDTQAVLALGRGRNQPKGYKYIFSGKLISGDTGYKFTGYKNKSNNYYYRIHKDKTKSNYDKREKSNISEKELVGYIMNHMEKILSKPKAELADMYNIKLQNGNEQGLQENEVDLIDREIKNLEKKKRNSYEDKQNNIIDLNEYITIKNEYEAKIRLLEERKNKITKLIADGVQNFNTALRIKGVLLKFKEAFENLTYDEQKQFCELIVSEITIYKHTKIISLAFSEGLLDFFEKSDPDDGNDDGPILHIKGGGKPKGGGNNGNNPMSKLVKSFSELESNNFDGGGKSDGYIQDSSLSPVKIKVLIRKDGNFIFDNVSEWDENPNGERSERGVLRIALREGGESGGDGETRVPLLAPEKYKKLPGKWGGFKRVVLNQNIFLTYFPKTISSRHELL